MGGRARVRAGVVWVCLALGAGGIVVLWTAGAGAAAPSVELMTDAAPVAGPAVDAEQANPAVDPQASQPPPDGRVAVEAEVADATFSDEPSPDQADPEQIDAWIRDLRDDDIRFNANEALAHLIAAGEAAAPALERALWSDDAQQRQFAARALRNLDRAATDRLLAVTADSVAQDLNINDECAYATLIRAGPSAIPFVRPLLDTGEYHERFCAAYALARLRDPLHAESIAHLMVRHLSHNNTRGDALFAANALYHIGAPAIPILQNARGYLDEQGRTLVDLILLDLREPPRTKADFAHRQALQQRHGISKVYADPVVEYSFLRSRLPYAKPPR